jgi:hypothetical protein
MLSSSDAVVTMMESRGPRPDAVPPPYGAIHGYYVGNLLEETLAEFNALTGYKDGPEVEEVQCRGISHD